MVDRTSAYWHNFRAFRSIAKPMEADDRKALAASLRLGPFGAVLFILATAAPALALKTGQVMIAEGTASGADGRPGGRTHSGGTY